MNMKHFIGIMLFVVMAMIAIGLFGVDEVKERPVINQTANVSTEPVISEYHGTTVEEAAEVGVSWILVIVFLLGVVYIGGIVHDEQRNSRYVDDEDGDHK